MSANGDDPRRALLEHHGRLYAKARLAIAWTTGIAGDAAKRVETRSWQTTVPLTDAEFAAGLFATRGLARNPAVTARTSSLILIDCDTPEGLAEIQRLALPTTWTVRSSEDYKRHFYFRPPTDAEQLPKVGFRFEEAGLSADANRYLVAPPALHPSGTTYSFLPELGPEQIPLAELPLVVYRHLLEQAASRERETRELLQIDPHAKVRAGRRRESVFRFACMHRRWTNSHDEILTAALRWNEAHCEPPLPPALVAGQVDGAMKMQGGQELAVATEAVADPAAGAKEPPEGDALWQGELPDGAALLDEIEAVLGRYMVMSGNESTVAALYVVLTYGFELFDVVPYLRVASATKRCGKTRLLDLLEMLVHGPLPSGGMSEAALFRSLNEGLRTVLFDEIGKVLNAAQADRNSDLLRVFLNGYAVGKPVQRCVGEGTRQTVEDFNVYGPKVLAGTGQLDDQILDRCFPIDLRRKRRDEPVARFRRRIVKQECAQMRSRIAAWVDAHAEQLRDARPELPEELDDRGQDIAESLLAIADLASGEWPQRARTACVALRDGSNELEDDVGVQLLIDIRQAFAGDERLTTEDMLKRVTADQERPWAHWSKGLPMNAMQLARKLRPFGVRSKKIRFADKSLMGYERAAFEDAFTRYVPSAAVLPGTPGTSAQPSQKRPSSDPEHDPSCSGSENGQKPHNQAIVPGVSGMNAEQASGTGNEGLPPGAVDAIFAAHRDGATPEEIAAAYSLSWQQVATVLGEAA